MLKERIDKADLSNLGQDLSSQLCQQKTQTLQTSCVRDRGACRGIVRLSRVLRNHRVVKEGVEKGSFWGRIWLAMLYFKQQQKSFLQSLHSWDVPCHIRAVQPLLSLSPYTLPRRDALSWSPARAARCLPGGHSLTHSWSHHKGPWHHPGEPPAPCTCVSEQCTFWGGIVACSTQVGGRRRRQCACTSPPHRHYTHQN